MEVVINILSKLQEWLPAITGLIASCAAIAALTPSKADDVVVQKILDFINVVGLNIGKAKNKDA
jgi:hypothetical protein